MPNTSTKYPPPRTVLLTAGQAAAYLGLHLNSISRYADLPETDRRHLPCQRIPPHPRSSTADPTAARLNVQGGHRRFTLTDLELWAAKNLPAAPYPWET